MLASRTSCAFGRQPALRCDPTRASCQVRLSHRRPAIPTSSCVAPADSNPSPRQFTRRAVLTVCSASVLPIIGQPTTTASAKMKLMKLYDFPLAFNPPKAKLILVEKKAEFETEIIDILAGQGISPEYLKINPAGTAPTLQDGEKLITESKAIIEYVDNKDGQPLGGNNVDRGAVKEWLDLVDKWDGNLFAAGMGGPAAKLLGVLSDYKKQYAQARMAEHPELREIYEKKLASMEKMGKESSDPTAIESNKQQLHSLLDKAEGVLAKQPYLAGAEYSAADVIITPVLFRIHTFSQDSTYVDPRPHVKEYYKRLQARPSFDRTFSAAQNPIKAAGLVLPDLVKTAWSSLTGVY